MSKISTEIQTHEASLWNFLENVSRPISIWVKCCLTSVRMLIQNLSPYFMCWNFFALGGATLDWFSPSNSFSIKRPINISNVLALNPRPFCHAATVAWSCLWQVNDGNVKWWGRGRSPGCQLFKAVVTPEQSGFVGCNCGSTSDHPKCFCSTCARGQPSARQVWKVVPFDQKSSTKTQFSSVHLLTRTGWFLQRGLREKEREGESERRVVASAIASKWVKKVLVVLSA